MASEKIYMPDYDETALEFVRRVVREQPDREPLHILELLTEIVFDELRDQPYDISAEASALRTTLKVRHHGRPIDERTVRIMLKFTDRVDYMQDGDAWVLTIPEGIPSRCLFISSGGQAGTFPVTSISGATDKCSTFVTASMAAADVPGAN